MEEYAYTIKTTYPNELSALIIYQNVNFKIMIGNKICNFITQYSSPSQHQDDFQAFIDNLEMTLETLVQENSLLMVVIVILTQNKKNWCSQDSKRSLIWWLNLVFTHLCIQIVTIRLYLQNLIPHETIVCDDKDPSWFDKAIKSLIQEKKEKYCKSNNDIQLLQHLRFLQGKLN